MSKKIRSKEHAKYLIKEMGIEPHDLYSLDEILADPKAKETLEEKIAVGKLVDAEKTKKKEVETEDDLASCIPDDELVLTKEGKEETDHIPD